MFSSGHPIIGEIDKLERVQRRVANLIPLLRNKPYEERFREVNLFNVNKIKMRRNLIRQVDTTIAKQGLRGALQGGQLV